MYILQTHSLIEDSSPPGLKGASYHLIIGADR